MALTKETIVDQIIVVEDGAVLYREATRIVEDGKLISQTYHRTSLTPDQDITTQPEKVQAVCNAAWTPEIRQAYAAFKLEQANRLGTA